MEEMEMLGKKVTGLEGMLNIEEGIFEGTSGNAFSSARVLAGYLAEEDLSGMVTYDSTQDNVSGKVVGLEGMLEAIEGIPNNGNYRPFGIAEQLAGLLTEEDLPEIVTLEVA